MNDYRRYHTKLFVLFIILAGCADGEFPQDEYGNKLIGGQVTSLRPEIGRLSLNGSLCTATLIRPRVVISAAHCVGYNSRSGRWGHFVVDRGQSDYRYAIESVFSFGNRLGDKDIALIHLAEAVPTAIAKPTSIAINEPTQGEVTIFGYGCSNRRTNRGPRAKQFYTHRVSEQSNQLCPGDSGGPVVIGSDGPVFKINSGYYSGGRQGDIFGRPSQYYRELSAYANVLNMRGLSNLQDFIRKGGINQEGGDVFIGGGQAQQDTTPPSVIILSPDDQSLHDEHSMVEIRAEITDDNDFIEAALIWDFNGISYPCPTQQRYVTCTQDGQGGFTWSVEVSEGERAFRIRALDIAGKESISETHKIYLGGADDLAGHQTPSDPEDHTNPSPPTIEAPQVQVLSPVQHTETAQNSSVEIVADIQSDIALREVVLVWDYNEQRYPCPTRQRYADCDVSGSQYIWTIRVTSLGARPFHIEATNQQGQRGMSNSYQIDVTTQVDQNAPDINVLNPSQHEQWYEDTEVEINVEITDPSGVDSAFLRWGFNGNDYPCPHRSQYVDCEVNGALYQWRVRVSEGERSFRIWARDHVGNSEHSQRYDMELKR